MYSINIVSHLREGGRVSLVHFPFPFLCFFFGTPYVQFAHNIDLVKMLLMYREMRLSFIVGWMGGRIGLMFLFYVLICMIRSCFQKVKRYVVVT